MLRNCKIMHFLIINDKHKIHIIIMKFYENTIKGKIHHIYVYICINGILQLQSKIQTNTVKYIIQVILIHYYKNNNTRLNINREKRRQEI